MTEIDMSNLRYRRQYILTPVSIECPFAHRHIQLDPGYRLYHHIDLPVSEHSQGNNKLVLIGDIFDYTPDKKSNLDILKEIADADFNVILERSAKYTGRYVIIFLKGGDLYAFTDATASRKIFYAAVQNSLWIASQPYLLANVLNLKDTNDEGKYNYYHSRFNAGSFCLNMGGTTYYDEISQLIPNHYLFKSTYKKTENIRFWPSASLAIQPLELAVHNCATLIKGYMENIAARFEVMLPVTSGYDSRQLLAASKEITDRVYFYLNTNLLESKADLEIPTKLLNNLGLKFNITGSNENVDDSFRKKYFENSPFATEKFLGVIYGYYKYFEKKVNLPGNVGVYGLDYYRTINDRVSNKDIIDLLGIQKYRFAIDFFSEWYSETMPKIKKTNVSILSLLYWEHRVTNGLYQIQLDKDIAQEEFNPYNSREYIQNYLSVHIKYTQGPDYPINREITQLLWPDTMQLPINPSLKNDVKRAFTKIRVLNILYFIKIFFTNYLFRKH